MSATPGEAATLIARQTARATVCVTGANGFVGREVCSALAVSGFEVRAAVRSAGARAQLPRHERVVPVSAPALTSDADWSDALDRAAIVVHLAARVHVMTESSADPEQAFRAANVDGTVRLAERARAAGVRRFVYMSSIKVNGERTAARPFSGEDAPAPEDAYARSKRDAERELVKLARPSFEIAIIRPPLVYGAGVAANFRLLLRLASSGLPLPLGAIRNARSLVSVWNLADFVRAVCDAREPASGIWLVSDGEDVSTPDLVRRLSRALGRTPHLLPIPTVILRAGAALIGRTAEMRRLTDSLQIDSQAARTRLGWSPGLSLDEGLGRTARAFLLERNADA